MFHLPANPETRPSADHEDVSLSESELFELLESDDYEPGLARACGDIGEPDSIDTAIHLWIDKLAETYEDASAQQAVFDALSELCADGHLSEPPMVEADDSDKNQWIYSFNELINAKLHSMGLEF